MTTTFTLRYEGAPSCVDCQREGVPLCAHVGFNPEAWDGMIGQGVHAPGLDPAYPHIVRSAEIASDRKTITLTIDTERPDLMDLARHLSRRPDVNAKAAVRAVHHETGEQLEEGFYDHPLTEGMQVAIDRDLYAVVRIEHPNRDPETGAAGQEIDWQVAYLAPQPDAEITPST